MDLFSLFQAQIPTTANKLFIAFSGGLDSTALLSLVKKLSEKRPHLSLRAIHIHHGLSPNAVLGRLIANNSVNNLPFHLLLKKSKWKCMMVLKLAQEKLRYQAISTHIQPDEYLVTAHH